MAPKKRQNSKKSGNPSKKPKRARFGVPDSGYETDHNGQPAVPSVIGVVLNNGLFECRVHVEGQRCGARMINERPNIRSHYSKQHSGEGSAYKQGQALGWKWPCTYGCEYKFHENFHTLLAHARTVHNHQGESQSMKEASMELRKKLQGRGNDGQGEEDNDDDNDDNDADDDDSDLVPPPDRPDRHSYNDRQDPPDASGSLPSGAAA
ncbi:hypothetical protein F5Y06DRAFT_306418 [Hypoxylon sp. FL0890]|nr:hypothetical protein F5Y06DRAFT_306418 [Hypoxylon sp. FL0890]